MVKLFPVINVDDPKMRYIWKGLEIEGIVIRLQDLICQASSNPNSTFYKIKNSGGIHKFLGFSGKIVLSLIMKDRLISKFNHKKYSEIINIVNPDFYTTVDGETYDGEEELSYNELKRCILETVALLKLCKNAKPIGLIKGCNEQMVLFHVQVLKLLGVNDFLLHMGDFSRHGDINMINKAKKYASLIRKYADKPDNLFLYGFGSQNKLIEFSFADFYITFNHFVKAMKGYKYVGVKKFRYSGGYSPNIVKQNLNEMLNNVNKISEQKKLIDGGKLLWVEEKELIEPATRRRAQNQII